VERPDVRERLTAMLGVAFAQGVGGLAADTAGYMLRPWGFDLDDVNAKTLLLYGADDQVAAPRHGKWYQRICVTLVMSSRPVVDIWC
jgi:hypothetical protein